jgi:hypothetical protein
MTDNRPAAKHRGLGLFAVTALVGALLVPLVVVSTASAGPHQDEVCGVSQALCEEPHCPEDDPIGVTQGGAIDDVCCREDLMSHNTWGVAQGDEDVGVECCPNGEFRNWQWGGYAGQNLSYCDAPPYEPPATAPTTDPPAVSPATAAPKKAAAAKPTFTG